MKGISSSVVRAIQHGSWLFCTDNSGAKLVRVITVYKYKGRKRKLAKGGVGDVVLVSVKTGKADVRKKTMKAVIVRQKKAYRRTNGWHVGFEDNACVIVDDKGLPKGSEVKGIVAKEAAERFPKVAGISAGVV